MGLFKTTETFTDHTTEDPLVEIENPEEPSFKLAEEPGIGLSLLATQTTVRGRFLYQIPKKVFLELSGMKNPSSNLWPEDTNVWPSMRTWFGLKVSTAIEISEFEDSKM
jgi:hypothetical protein